MGKITAAITGVGLYLPDYILTNEELSTMVDTSDEWIMSHIGVKTRHILKGEGVGSSYMGARAVINLLDKAGVDPMEVDLVICATVTPDMFFPSTGNLIADQAGCKNAFAYDVSAACSGFLRTDDRCQVHRVGIVQEGGRGRCRQDVDHRRLYRPFDLSDLRRRRRSRAAGTQYGGLRRTGRNPAFGRLGRVATLHEGRRIALSGFDRDRAEQLAHDHVGRTCRIQGCCFENGRRVGGDHGAQQPHLGRHPLSGSPSGQPAHHRRYGPPHGARP